jgi:site-specific recombinase XerD
MAKIIKLYDSPVVVHDEMPDILSSKDLSLLQDIFQGYLWRRAGGKTLEEKTVRNEILTCKRFIAFCGKAPWYLTPSDFERWCFQIGKVEKLAPSTQRLYQSHVASFYLYITKNTTFQDIFQQEYNVTAQMVVNEDNRGVHRVEDESRKVRKAVPADEMNMALVEMKSAIRVAKVSSSKDYWPLQRDYAMFFLTVDCGLRAGEEVSIQTHSFRPDPAAPEYRKFAIVTVFGKGSKGSGLKRRDVNIQNPFLVRVLEWYVAKIRPHFLSRKNPDERAFFLSERGKGISYTTFLARFHHMMKIAGLDDMGYVPHCLRATSISEKTVRKMSLEAIRRGVGHVYASTTQGYTTVKDSFVQEEISDVQDANLAFYREYMAKKNSTASIDKSEKEKT